MNVKCNYVLPVLLLIIIVILCGYIFFFLKDNKSTDNQINNNKTAGNIINNNDSKESITYSYNDISGFYTFKDKNPNSENREELSTFGYYLYLSENGTFRYQYSMNTVSSTLGNYIIVGDEIRLNYLFNGGSDAAIYATNGEKVLKIIDKNTLVDSNAFFSRQGGLRTINLTRDTNSSYYNKDEFDINYIINNYILDNEHKLDF